MYIQITTRCNMKCRHCGMNCTSKGRDMDFDTFKEALKHSEYITLGGGEPTIHPFFEKFLFYAIAHCEGVHIITNGKKTDIALALAKMNNINEGAFSAELSQDPYHEPIDPKVVKAFGKNIRNNSRQLINAGRCDWGDNEDCICEDMFVLPNGAVKQCGCEVSFYQSCRGSVFFPALGSFSSLLFSLFFSIPGR